MKLIKDDRKIEALKGKARQHKCERHERARSRRKISSIGKRSELNGALQRISSVGDHRLPRWSIFFCLFVGFPALICDVWIGHPS